MSGKKGASTVPGAHTKLCTALNRLMGVGLSSAASNKVVSLISSMLQRFCTAGFQVEGFPHGIRRAALITLHREEEIISGVGSSVKVGTEEREVGAGVRSDR
jgi:hypothetical protein